MLTITKPNQVIQKFIKETYPISLDTEDFVFSKYCIVTEVDNKYAIFNTLNYSLVLLTKEEYENIITIPKHIAETLIELRILVPKDYDLKKIADEAFAIFNTPVTTNVLKNFNYAVIFTTTSCNAKCPYCFEGVHGGKDMSEKVANDTADFIIKNGKFPMRIRWFGGEPLYNFKASEIICDKLNEAKVPFVSEMFTNGYLINDENIKVFKEKMKIQRFQIPIDGTEECYNAIKNIDKIDDESPYKKVLNNVEKLVNNGFDVNIRINFDISSCDDQRNLIGELKKRFGKRVRYSIIPVYQSLKNGRTPEEREELLSKFYETKRMYGFGGSTKALPTRPRNKKCMADNGTAISILPGGEVGLCEHYVNNHFVGTIYSTEANVEEIKKIRERSENNYDICDDCPLYSYCYRLKICTELNGCSVCNEQLKKYNLNNFKARIKTHIKRLVR